MTAQRWRAVGWGAAACTAVALALLGAAGTPMARSMPGAAEPITRLLAAVAVTVAVCRLCGALATRLRQPAVVGEIAGGLLLGPSLLGLAWPGVSHWLFEGVAGRELVAQLGLVMFMFFIGRELSLGARTLPPRAICKGAVGSIGLPVAAGMAVAVPIYPTLAGPAAGRFEFVVFFGLAIAVTALPVLARVLADTGTAGSIPGRLALTCAAVGDGLSWSVLTLLLMVSASGSVRQLAMTVSLITCTALLTVLGARPALLRLIERLAPTTGMLSTLLVVGATGFAAVTQLIGLHAAIGAFVFGAILPRQTPAVDRAAGRLHDFTGAVLLPLFFAGAGLHTDLRAVGVDPGRLWLFGVLLVVASAPKLAGGALFARRVGLAPRDALCFGALMNCRGVTEIVIATIGLQHGLINEAGFTMLVLLALLTTATTAPLVRLLSKPGRLGNGLRKAPATVRRRQ
ncbi:hypothetical protein GCM10018953_47100 [Streptosporangium nondiastaticum]|uniref:cation:proton antiporter n=1 Tax=Streptosporangium nondiastaticum TaxID=35764 RepID=UPI0031F86BEB